MKRIKGVRKSTHKLIIKAVKNYYFCENNLNVAKYIFGENINLSEQELADARKIKFNLLDETYCKNLV